MPDVFKLFVQQKEVIHWAWELLTERFHMPKDRLYVTYFGGNPERNLEPDLVARDIWISVGSVTAIFGII